MTRDFGIRECDRCGKTITAFCPSLPTLSSIGEYLDKPEEQLQRSSLSLKTRQFKSCWSICGTGCALNVKLFTEFVLSAAVTLLHGVQSSVCTVTPRGITNNAEPAQPFNRRERANARWFSRALIRQAEHGHKQTLTEISDRAGR